MKTLFKFTTIPIILVTFSITLLAIQSQMAMSSHTEEEEGPHFTLRSRFLGNTVLKRGAHCNDIHNNICNGVSAKKGNELLYCCKQKCVDVLRDMNHCGKCGQKCKYGERCCHGVCTNVMKNVNNCGKCYNKCKHGIQCQMGFCGYA